MALKKQLSDIDIFFSDWYNEVVFASELADQAPIKGCIIIRPYGYAIWEEIQRVVNAKISAMGAKNVAFPTLVPYSFIAREKDHVDGFAPEVVVVTHAGGKKLEETYIVRPTSETLIHDAFGRWIRSWRDLPIRVNQWCSVIRWEKKPKAFIRTGEFWWQEGHTAHETSKEAYEQAYEARALYREYITNYLKIPVICGEKPSIERFAGAVATYTLEAMMRDGKALQMGTSHVLNQSFAHAFSIQFQNKTGGLDFVHLTSWGVTTRLIGAAIMVHGDQDGLVLPFDVAPIQFIIIPITKAKDSDATDAVNKRCLELMSILKQYGYRVEIDSNDEETPGFKFNKWELKGVPFRIELGARDLEKHVFVLCTRDTKEKKIIELNLFSQEFIEHVTQEYGDRLFNKAQKRMEENTKEVDLLSNIISNADSDDDEAVQKNKTATNNYFWKTSWCCAEETYPEFKKRFLTVRCILENEKASDMCCIHGKECGNKHNLKKVIVAKSY